MTRALRIGTRRSPLALAQAREVAAALPVPADLVPIVTAGDRLADRTPAPVDGRGVFVAELERALLRGEVDLCVHSAKDVPPQLPAGVELGAFPARAEARDCVVGRPLADLAAGARIATGSPRRREQLRLLRPDLRVEPVRGNVDTRLRRVRDGDFAAAVLAVAGLVRLGLSDAVAEVLEPAAMVPAAGQGALAVECRAGDPALAALAAVDDAATRFAVLAERAVLAGLGGGCELPAGAYAERLGTRRFRLQAVVCASGAVARASEQLEVDLADEANLGAHAAMFGARAVRALRRDGAAALLAPAGAGEAEP